MYKIKVFTIGRLREPWLQEALAEYEKRLSKLMTVEWVLAKSDADLADKVTSPYIALDVQGESLDSSQLSLKLKSLLVKHGSRINFLIGGAEGLDPKLLENSVARWSLSPLTFTHQMTRLILLEQLYRSQQIEAGTEYHK